MGAILISVAKPTLFDKLSMNHERRRMAHWRDILLRDVECLLNDAARSAALNLSKYKYCSEAVLNYGLPSLSKRLPINLDPAVLARHIQRIISTFEPRLDPHSIRVVPVVDAGQPYALAILFDIFGASLIPEDESIVNLRIALDYSCGAVRVL